MVQIARILLVKLIQRGLESDVKPIKVVNRLLGAAFAFAMIFFIGLLVLWIVAWVGGDTAASWEAYFKDSGFVGALYRNNPISGIADYISKYFPQSMQDFLPSAAIAVNGII